MEHWARGMLKAFPESLLSLQVENGKDITASDIARAAEREDKLASRIIDTAIDALAVAICHVITLLCPQRIVIGGGVSLMGDSLFAPLRERVAERVFKPFADCYDIVPAALGEEVVVHGALALALKEVSAKR
jgi:glucokinase